MKQIKDRMMSLCDLALKEWRCVSKVGNKITLNNNIHYLKIDPHKLIGIVYISIDEDSKNLFIDSYRIDKESMTQLINKIQSRDCETLEELLNTFGV